MAVKKSTESLFDYNIKKRHYLEKTEGLRNAGIVVRYIGVVLSLFLFLIFVNLLIYNVNTIEDVKHWWLLLAIVPTLTISFSLKILFNVVADISENILEVRKNMIEEN